MKPLKSIAEDVRKEPSAIRMINSSDASIMSISIIWSDFVMTLLIKDKVTQME